MSESRSSLDIIESEDTSLICLSQDIDVHTNHLRNAVLQTVAAIRTKIHIQTAEALDRQRERSFDTERQLLAQIETLQDLLTIRSEELRIVSEKHERLLALHQEQKLRAHTKAVAQAALRRWRDLVAKKKRNEMACETLIAQRNERQSRQAFTAWRLASLKQKSDSLLAKTVAEHRRHTTKLQHEHQAVENQLRMESLALKEKLSAEEQRRDLLEEKLKAAFMRGVCALNLEAMQVLRATAEQRQSGAADAATLASMMLQGLQASAQVGGRSNSAKTTESEISSATEDNSRSATNVAELLVAQQSAVNEQLVQPTAAASTASSANTSRVLGEVSLPGPTTTPPPVAAPPHRPASLPPQQQHQSFVVNVNPNYPAQRGGTTLTSTATKGARPSTSSSSFLLRPAQRK